MPCNSVIQMQSMMTNWKVDIANRMLARLKADNKIEGRLNVQFIDGQLKVEGSYLTEEQFAKIKQLCIQQYGVQVVKEAMIKMNLQAKSVTKLSDNTLRYVVGRN